MMRIRRALAPEGTSFLPRCRVFRSLFTLYYGKTGAASAFVDSAVRYPYRSRIWTEKAQGLKPNSVWAFYGTTEVVP
jgi:hypothetical protein